jgi:hypothetical protein
VYQGGCLVLGVKSMRISTIKTRRPQPGFIPLPTGSRSSSCYTDATSRTQVPHTCPYKNLPRPTRANSANPRARTYSTLVRHIEQITLHRSHSSYSHFKSSENSSKCGDLEHLTAHRILCRCFASCARNHTRWLQSFRARAGSRCLIKLYDGF